MLHDRSEPAGQRRGNTACFTHRETTGSSPASGNNLIPTLRGSSTTRLQARTGHASTQRASKHNLIKIKQVNEEYEDRKSTRLNSSHVRISYAVFCLKK